MPVILAHQALEQPGALVTADVINARSRSSTTSVPTVVSSVDMPTALKLPMMGIAGRPTLGPPVLREQEPGALTVITVDVADPVTSRSRSRSSAVGTVIVQGVSTVRDRPYSTASGFRAVTEAPVQQSWIHSPGFSRVGPPLLREQEQPSPTVVLTVVDTADQASARSRSRSTASASVIQQASATSRARDRSTAATLAIELPSATARDRAYATTSATTLQAIPQVGSVAVRLLQAGIVIRGGPPVLRDQEPGPATVQPVVSPADQVNARSRVSATASATDVVQAQASGRPRAYSTAASIVVSAAAMPAPVRLPSIGIRVAAGPPVLREQEPGALSAITVPQGSANARNRSRSTAVATVIVGASATSRERPRSQAASLVVVRASASARDRARATANALDIVQAQAKARSRARATATSLIIQFAIEAIIRAPRPGISRTGGPPILREQELTPSSGIVAVLGEIIAKQALWSRVRSGHARYGQPIVKQALWSPVRGTPPEEGSGAFSEDFSDDFD